jgi:hypothetical protein
VKPKGAMRSTQLSVIARWVDPQSLSALDPGRGEDFSLKCVEYPLPDSSTHSFIHSGYALRALAGLKANPQNHSFIQAQERCYFSWSYPEVPRLEVRRLIPAAKQVFGVV